VKKGKKEKGKVRFVKVRFIQSNKMKKRCVEVINYRGKLSTVKSLYLRYATDTFKKIVVEDIWFMTKR
jgi:hypothetical protein